MNLTKKLNKEGMHMNQNELFVRAAEQGMYSPRFEHDNWV